MTRNIKIILVSSFIAALLLSLAFFTLRRADIARDESLNWDMLDRICATQGCGKAIALLDGRLAQHPNDSMLLYFKARVLYTEGFGQAALVEADRSIKLGYSQELSHLLKGLIYGRLFNDYQKEKEFASKALTFDPTYDEAYIIRAEAEFVLKEYGACVEDAGSFINMDPKDPWGFETSLLCREGLGDHKGAERDGLKMLALKPKSHAAYWHLGMIYEEEGLHAKAIRFFGEAIRLSGGRSQYYLSRAKACEAVGDFSCSAWDYYSAMDWKDISNYASYYYLLGSDMHVINEPKYALEAADTAIKKDPSNPDYYELRGRIRADAGKLALARKDFQKMFILSPDKKAEASNLIEELKKK